MKAKCWAAGHKRSNDNSSPYSFSDDRNTHTHTWRESAMCDQEKTTTDSKGFPSLFYTKVHLLLNFVP